MRYRKVLLYLSILGILVLLAGLAVRCYIVRAARVEHAVAPAPYFPPGSPWTQDISLAPFDPQSSAIINWLASTGGWGHGNRMQVDFSMRALTADASTPRVRIRKEPNWISAINVVIPLPGINNGSYREVST
jgi:hypothetical protein